MSSKFWQSRPGRITLVIGLYTLVIAVGLYAGSTRQPKVPQVASIPSDSCISCHTDASIINSMAAVVDTGPSESAGG